MTSGGHPRVRQIPVASLSAGLPASLRAPARAFRRHFYKSMEARGSAPDDARTG